MGPENERLGSAGVDVKRVLHRSGGVVLRDVQRLEGIVVGLHQRPFGHLESESDKDVDDLLQHLGERVKPACARHPAGERDVQALGLQAALPLRAVQLGQLFRDGGLDQSPHPVGHLANDLALLDRQHSQGLADPGQRSLAAQVGDLQLLNALRGIRAAQSLQGFFFYCLQLADRAHECCPMAQGCPSIERGRVKQKIAPLSEPFSTQIRPPCASTSPLEMYRPRPVPGFWA